MKFASGIFFLVLTSFTLTAVEIAVTLDDHPLPDGELFSLNERVDLYCRAFEKYACKGAFFCVGSYCRDTKNPVCLTQLNRAGHFLANHSWSHKHLSSIGLREFQEEIEATDAILSGYSQFRKWFRFPYLDYGSRYQMGGSDEKFLGAIEILRQLDYREGFVTINTFDWHIDSRLKQAIQEGKNIDYQKLKEVYLLLLNEWCAYYVQAYDEVIPEDEIHVLLLHANDLNALFLDAILEMIQKNGWKIVSPEKAFLDPPWRKKLLKHPESVPEKPASLDEQAIDRVLETYHVFS